MDTAEDQLSGEEIDTGVQGVDETSHSWRVDHENSVVDPHQVALSLDKAASQATVQESASNTVVATAAADERRLLDGGPLSNHLIDLERQQQVTTIGGASGGHVITAQPTRAPGQGIVVASQEFWHTEYVQALGEGQQCLKKQGLMHGSASGQCEVEKRWDLQQKEARRWREIVETFAAEQVSTILGSETVPIMDDTGAQQFTFHPSQSNTRNLGAGLAGSLDLQDQDDQLLTARTVQNGQNCCFEPRFEHEEGGFDAEDQASNLLYLDNHPSDTLSSTLPTARNPTTDFFTEPVALKHHFTQKNHTTEASPILPRHKSHQKFDINDGPISSEPQSITGVQQALLHPQDFLQQEDCSRPGRHHQGGNVPLVRDPSATTLSDTGGPTTNTGWNERAMSPEARRQPIGDTRFDDCTDDQHLYDSDVGYSGQVGIATTHRQSSCSPQVTPAALSFTRQQQSALDCLAQNQEETQAATQPRIDESSFGRPQTSLFYPKQAKQVGGVDMSPDDPILLSDRHGSAKRGRIQAQARSQPNLLFQPFQVSGGGRSRLASISPSSSRQVLPDANLNRSSPFSNGEFKKEEDGDAALRESSTTAITQLVTTHASPPAIVAEPQQPTHSETSTTQQAVAQPVSLYAAAPQEEEKVPIQSEESKLYCAAAIASFEESQLLKSNQSLPFPSPSLTEQQSHAQAKETSQASSQFALPNPEQLKTYESMVAQIIRDSIEKENRALKQQIKQLQINEQKRNNQAALHHQYHHYSPVQGSSSFQHSSSRASPFQPKNPKIFSKPNFAVSSKSYRPSRGGGAGQASQPGAWGFGGFHPNRQVYPSTAQTTPIQIGSTSLKREGSKDGKKDESFECSEVIEELIEIEESGDENSNEEETKSVTVRTNLAAAGGRPSIGSVGADDNTSHMYNEELKAFGGRMSPHTVLSQRFFDQQSFYGFRRDLDVVQRQRSNMACLSTYSQGPDNNQELEYEDLEALFNYNADHYTENDEASEAPFYVPSCMEGGTREGLQAGQELFQNLVARKRQRAEALSQVSPRIHHHHNARHVDENTSVDAIYRSTTAFDLVQSAAGSETGRRRSLNSVGLEESKTDRQQTEAHERPTETDSHHHRSSGYLGGGEATQGRLQQQQQQQPHVVLNETGHRGVGGNLDDDDMVNQNSSHDGRSQHQSRSMLQQRIEIDLTHSTYDQPVADNSPLGAPQSALLLQGEGTNQAKLAEKATQMSDVTTRLRRSTDSSVKKLESGPQRFTYFAASSLADDRWVCPICLDIFVDAVETPCCHNLFCERCIKNTRCCPLCNMRIIGALKPNIPIRRLVLELSQQCPNQNCKMKIRRCDQERHLETCQYTLLACPNNEQVCGQILRKDLANHTRNHCLFRKVNCLLDCGVELRLNDMDGHIATECSKAEMPCANQCGRVVQRGVHEEHLRGDCPEQVVSCPNKGESLFEDGCNAKLKRHELEAHRQACVFRRLMCPNQKCASVIMYKNLSTHDERCLFKIVECDNKCGTKVLRQNMQQHRDTCEYQLVRCPYFDLGCKIEILRKDYREHLIEENFNHSIVFIEGQKKKNKEIEDLQTEISSLRKDYDSEMQWMYVEMQMMKAEMKKLLQKPGNGGLSGDQNPLLENQNSSFGENQASFQRHRVLEESKQENAMQHYSFVFARGAQADQGLNQGQHFGGTRYNQVGAQSMSVASVSVANQRQSNQDLNQRRQGGLEPALNITDMNHEADTGREIPKPVKKLAQQLIDISDELEPRVPAGGPGLRPGTLAAQNDALRPKTRRGRIDISRFSQGLGRGGVVSRENKDGDNFDDATSADYLIDRQNSIPNSREHHRGHYLNEPAGSGIHGLSALNPLTAIDGARNQNDSIRVGPRQSLSAAVSTLENRKVSEPASVQNESPSWMHRGAKPPLFRHQMMMRTSEPNYSASQNNSLSVSTGQQPAPEINPTSNLMQQATATKLPSRPNEEGSERKNNPLAYLLASANASVNTTQQVNNPQAVSAHPIMAFSREEDPQHIQQQQQLANDSRHGFDGESVLNILDRLSNVQGDDHQSSSLLLSNTQKAAILTHMTGSQTFTRNSVEESKDLQEQRGDARRYPAPASRQTNQVSSSVGSGLLLRQHRIRKVPAHPAATKARQAAAIKNNHQLQQMSSAALASTQAAAQIKNDLDGSNVLYDEDFEVEEEHKEEREEAERDSSESARVNNCDDDVDGPHFAPQNASSLFNP